MNALIQAENTNSQFIHTFPVILSLENA